MPRTPGKAFKRYISPIKTAYACLTREALDIPRADELKEGSTLIIGSSNNTPARLKMKVSDKRGVSLWVFVGQNIKIVPNPRLQGQYKIETQSYKYQLLHGENEADLSAILDFHWIRRGKGNQAVGHLHVGSCVLAEPYSDDIWNLHKAHIVTERIALEDFVAMIIDEFRINNIQPAWKSKLESTKSLYERYKTA